MSATLTITLPTELAQAVSAKATASGKGLEDYFIYLAQRDAELPSLRDIFADVRADIQARGITDEELNQDIDEAIAETAASPPKLQTFLQTMAAGTANVPVLPQATNERAFYYENERR